MKEIKVSVIVPVYNTEKFLRKCIESIINQTLKEKEIILINDGSTDNSNIICEEYSKKYPNEIKYINNKNIGCSATRNLGISLAKGEYIAFVDSDDYIDKEMYQEMYEKAKKENLDVVICGIKYIYPITNKIIYSYPKNILRKYDYLKEKNRMANCYNKLYKREQIIKNNLFFPVDTHYAEDLYFSFINLVIAKNICHIEKCYYNYILHGENSIYNLDKRFGVFISFNKLYMYLFKNGYLSNNFIKKIFFENFKSYVIRGTFFTLINPEQVEYTSYKTYIKSFHSEMKKINYLRIREKVYIEYYRFFIYIIREYNLYFILRKIKRKLKK